MSSYVQNGALRSMRDGPASMARRPLFDAQQRVVAWDLLYRLPLMEDPAQSSPSSGAVAALAATLDIGVRRLSCGLALHVQVPPGLIEAGLQPRAPAAAIVLELPEQVQAGAPLLSRLEALRRAGHHIALNNFDIGTHSLRLIEAADLVRVDMRRHAAAGLATTVQALRRYPVRLLAAQIRTREELGLCRQLRFDLFQGDILNQPQAAQTGRAPAGRIAALQLLLRLADAGDSLDEVEAVVRTDPVISYQVLRSINSSYSRRHRPVQSLREAVLLLGMEELHRLCWTMLLAGLDSRHCHACVQALQRARMCELLCNAAGLPGAEGCFVAGMLSMLDVLLGQPLQDILRSLPIPAAMTEALLFRRGELGELLRCVEYYQRGDWRLLQFRQLGAEHVVAAYLLATEWADLVWSRAPDGT